MGSLSVEHELAYAKMDGPKRQGIEKTIRSSVAEGDVAEELKRELGMRDQEVSCGRSRERPRSCGTV
jgi:hypothetical protein